MQKLQHQLNSHLRQSQVKSNKLPRTPYKLPVAIGSIVKKQKGAENKAKAIEATNKASYYIDMLRSRQGLMNKLVPMIAGYDEIVPSQGWLASEVDYCLKTAFNGLKELNQLDIIKKVGRGWRAINPKFKVFVSNTCSYSFGNRFKEDMKFIADNDNSYRQNIKKLFAAIPALYLYFKSVYVLNDLFHYYIALKGNNNTKGNGINSKNYVNIEEISEIYKKNRYSLVSSVSEHAEELCLNGSAVDKYVRELGLNDQVNVYHKEHKYTDENVKEKKGMINEQIRIEQRITQKGEEGIGDIRFLFSEHKFNKLSREDKATAKRYLTERIKRGTVLAYDEYLLSVRKKYLICNPPEDALPLTKMEIDIIKLFSEDDIQFVKKKLKRFPENKNSFEWIYDILKHRSKINMAEFKKSLRAKGLLHKHIFAIELDSANERSDYRYRPFVPPKRTTNKSNKEHTKQRDDMMEAAEIKKLLSDNGFYHEHIFKRRDRPCKPQESQANNHDDKPKEEVTFNQKAIDLLGMDIIIGIGKRAKLV